MEIELVALESGCLRQWLSQRLRSHGSVAVDIPPYEAFLEVASGRVFQEQWHSRDLHVATTNVQLLQRTWRVSSLFGKGQERAQSNGAWTVKVLLTISGFLLVQPQPCPVSPLWEEALV